VAPVHTAIRGITIYNGDFTATLRVVHQGGANISTYSFQLEPVKSGGQTVLGPQAMDQWFGAQQNGSAFVPIDIDVPAGDLVGIDYTLVNSTSGAGKIDFVGYVWFDQSTPFSPPADY
jgi:hypothetical protein